MLKKDKDFIIKKEYNNNLLAFKQKLKKISKDKESSILLAKQLSRLIKANKF